MKCLYLFSCILFFQSCSLTRSRLGEALQQSGKNREELERVLQYFSQKETDSLHLKAAQFLITHMPGHYSWQSEELEQYSQTMDSIHPNMPSTVKKVVYSIPWHNDNIVTGDKKKIEDIKVIKADFLIAHINRSIKMWQQTPWLVTCSFEDFCEYLLPYRLGDEPLILEEDTNQQHIRENIIREMSMYGYTPRLLEEVRLFFRAEVEKSESKYFPRLNTGNFERGEHTMDCLDMCYYDVLGMRSAGVPSTIDFVPNWPTRNGRHYWRVIHDPVFKDENFCEPLNQLAGKVYRMTYSHQPMPVPDGVDSIPSLFQNPFLKDVTAKYMNVSDIEINVKRKLDNLLPKYLYLAVFNDLEWKPIAWSKYENGKGLFRYVGRNVVYLPVCYQGGGMKGVGHPFYVDRNGSVEEFVPDHTRRISVTLHRKYPLTYSKIYWGKSLEGCVLEASNHADFTETDTLSQINGVNAELNWCSLPVNDIKKYRYWRISKAGRPITLAELQFVLPNGDIIQGTPMSSGKGGYSDKAFDNNPLTYQNYLGWVGVDLGKPVALKEARYLPRTDYNGIIPGHLYRLLYFDETGWVEVDTKEALGQDITFHHVPSKALYWLQNLTEGKEERIFTVENDEIVFH